MNGNIMKKEFLILLGLLVSTMMPAQNGGNIMNKLRINCLRKAEEMCM